MPRDPDSSDEEKSITEEGPKIDIQDPLEISNRSIFFSKDQKPQTKMEIVQEKLLDEVGVATVSGTSFGHLGEGYIRFSYASSTENIREALARVKDFMSARMK